MPRFDEPCYTIDAEAYFAGPDAPAPLVGDELPPLRDPPASDVATASPEPMVRLAHRRIRTLNNYWHAGWRHAIASTWVRADIAMRLGRVAAALPARWGLAVFDGWRPLDLQFELFEVASADPTIAEGLFALPSRLPLRPPPHVSGGAVDVTLTVDGIPLGLGTGFDDTGPAAATDFFEQPAFDDLVSRPLRRALFHAMTSEGFVVYPGEWWHFEHGTVRWAAITGGIARYAATAPPS